MANEILSSATLPHLHASSTELLSVLLNHKLVGLSLRYAPPKHCRVSLILRLILMVAEVGVEPTRRVNFARF
jgi:hypothetical protein